MYCCAQDIFGSIILLRRVIGIWDKSQTDVSGIVWVERLH